MGRSLNNLVLTLVWLYLMCNAGEEVTNHFLEISNLIYKCPWDELPIKLQRYIPHMIAVAQRPVYIEGMGNLRCTRETFKMVQQLNIIFIVHFVLNFQRQTLQVIKTGFSYFIVVRQSMQTQMQIYRLYRSFKSGPSHL